MKKILSSLLLFVFLFGSLNFSQENLSYAQTSLDNNSDGTESKTSTTKATDKQNEKATQKKIRKIIDDRLATLDLIDEIDGDLGKKNNFVFYQAMNELFFNYGIWIEQARDDKGKPVFRAGTNREIPLFRIYSLKADEGKDEKEAFVLPKISQENLEEYLFDKDRQKKLFTEEKTKRIKEAVKTRKTKAEDTSLPLLKEKFESEKGAYDDILVYVKDLETNYREMSGIFSTKN
jgi:hypothetical protein